MKSSDAAAPNRTLPPAVGAVLLLAGDVPAQEVHESAGEQHCKMIYLFVFPPVAGSEAVRNAKAVRIPAHIFIHFLGRGNHSMKHVFVG